MVKDLVSDLVEDVVRKRPREKVRKEETLNMRHENQYKRPKEPGLEPRNHTGVL